MNFECPEGCGKCCGVIPFKFVFVEKNKDKFAVIPKDIKKVIDIAAVNTVDGYCVFLDRKTMRCNIYDERPEVCRLFGDSNDMMLKCRFYDFKTGKERNVKEREKIDKAIIKAKKKTQKQFRGLR